MSRRRVEVASVGPGFVADGHLFGSRAFVVEVTAGGGDAETPAYHELLDRLRRSGLSRLHVVVAPRCMLAAADLLHYLADNAPVTPTMAFPPGEFPRTEALVYESVLSVRPGASWGAGDLDVRAGSVSVHYWPGEAVLRGLAEQCPSPYGRFLVLPREDVGAAKVWMASARDDQWQLLPAYDFEVTEPAEAEQMGVGGGR